MSRTLSVLLIALGAVIAQQRNGYVPYPYPYYNGIPYGQFPAYPQPYPQPCPQPYPQPYPNNVADANIPTEIIDLDDFTPRPQYVEVRQRPVVARINNQPIIKTTEQHYSSNTNGTQGVHIFENKPISTHLHRVIVSDGKSNKNINIRLVNGVEVTDSPTTSTTEAETTTTTEEDAENKSDEEPKPITSWLF